MKTTIKKDVYTLCGTQGCCPTVTIYQDLDKVIIKDDFGGKVTLTKNEWTEALNIK